MTKDTDLAKFLTRERHAIHLIGVAGSGMSGIAGLLLQLRHEVSGSDKLDSLETDRLERFGLNTVLVRDLDQAALYGTLNRILSLGFELIELRRLTDSAN